MTHLSTARIAADPNAIGTCCGLPSTAGARLIATSRRGHRPSPAWCSTTRSTGTRWPGSPQGYRFCAPPKRDRDFGRDERGRTYSPPLSERTSNKRCDLRKRCNKDHSGPYGMAFTPCQVGLAPWPARHLRDLRDAVLIWPRKRSVIGKSVRPRGRCARRNRAGFPIAAFAVVVLFSCKVADKSGHRRPVIFRSTDMQTVLAVAVRVRVR